MKKLIAISVVFALVAGVAFAVDLGGTVIGTVDVLKSTTADGAKVESGASMDRVRIDGSGENGDGNFGGYFRFNGAWVPEGSYFPWAPMAAGNAWWKPLDQFKLIIGSNGGDGFYGKEGVTGWMFYQTATDTGVSMGGGNVWGGGYGSTTYRSAFYGGDGGSDAARLEISPADIAKINIMIPFFDGGETADVFKQAHFQLDLNLDFGNIAVTYVGNIMEADQQPTVFAYYGNAFGDLSLDFGVGFKFPNKDPSYSNPIAIGVGVKYALDTLGVKFRVVANVGGDNKETDIVTEVMPYFILGDNLTAFVSVGLSMAMPDGTDTVVGWHFNPYLQVGEEWGAKFLAGIKASSVGGKDAIIEWSVPIALIVSF